MIRVEFENLIPGNIYYDVDEHDVIPAKFLLVEKTGRGAIFVGLSHCSMYSTDEDGFYHFNSMYFYKNDFKFGR